MSGLPMGRKLSEDTLNKTTKGFKRFNIMANNAPKSEPHEPQSRSGTSTGLRTQAEQDLITSNRKSILLDNEYDFSELNPHSQGEAEAEVVGDKAAAEAEAEVESVTEVEAHTKTVPEPSTASSKGSSTSAKFLKTHVKSSKVRYKKDGEMRSNFGDLIFQPRETIFDKEIHYGTKFYGFYIAIWIIIFFFGLNTLCEYHLSEGNIFNSQIMTLMLKDIWKVALTDLAMYLSMYTAVIIQMLIKNNIINWKYVGFTLQAIFEVLLLWCPFHFADRMEYPWIAQIFLMLHSVVMLMKVHSYAFYNGYLWEISQELEFSRMFYEKKDSLTDDIVKALENSITFCKSEIQSQDFPNNITFCNFFNYSMFPVLVYQSKYPRNEKIRYDYLFQKVAGIFGIILLMIAIAQYRLYPIVMKCLELQATTSFWFRVQTYPFILIETIPPFLSVYLLTFYLIWELILNAIAELTRFADREFYRYWWNSVDWNEYARDWNVPVHKFLLRHVYHSSLSALHVDKTTATVLTFGLSSIVHELAMYVIFKKIRFYLTILQMSQLSLVQLSRSKWMRDKFILGNCIFWTGIVFGPSLMCTMYLVF